MSNKDNRSKKYDIYRRTFVSMIVRTMWFTLPMRARLWSKAWMAILWQRSMDNCSSAH